GAPPRLPQSVFQVLPHLFPGSQAPNIPRLFPDKQFVAELPARIAFGLEPILAALYAVPGSHAEMRADLFVQFVIQPPPLQQPFPDHMRLFPSLPAFASSLRF